MSALRLFLRRVRGLFFRDRDNAAMTEEMRFHLEERAADHAADGLAAQEARLMARRKFGGEEQLKELCRDQRGLPCLEDAIKDVRHAARVLRRNAGFALVAILTLALGIGATTVMFSLVHTTMLQPLPYRDPGQLVRVWDTNAKRGLTDFSASAANFISWREETRLLSGLAAWRYGSATLVTAGMPEKVELTRISGNLLSLLGLAPIAGRDFLPEEDSPSGKELVLLISDRFWEQRFQRSPAAFGQSLMIDGYAFTIVGVAPPQLAAIAPGDLWKPLAIRPGAEPRNEHWLRVVGRLQPGVSLAAGQKEMDAIADRLAVQFPDSNENWGIRLEAFRDWIVPASARQALLVLFGAVGCVLLIAVANLTNLLLVRALARAREIALRAALGASRSRIARQLVAENGLLVAIGAGTGWLLALWGVQLLRVFRPGDLPRLDELQLDATALAFALGLSSLTALVVSLLPAWQAGRVELQSAIKQEGAVTAPARGFAQSGMAIAQLALCAVLLVAAALFAQSFVRLQHTALGFAPEGVRLFRLSLDSPRYGAAREQIAFQRALTEKIAALPGVTRVGVTTAAPFDPALHRMTTRIGGRASALPAGELLSVERFNVGPGYFEAIGAPLRAGRFFDERDIVGAAPVALLNEAAARRLWPGEDAVGKTAIWNTPFTVIGVVADVKNIALDRPAQPAIYVPAYQLARYSIAFAVRATGAGAGLYDAIRREVRVLDPGLPLFDARSLEDALWEVSARPRFNTGLLGGFALVAVLLAAIGLYGITAYAVVRRTREFGLRMALGAQRREVLWLVLQRGVLHAALGVAAGLALSALFAQTLRSLLHEVDATDPVTFVVIALVLGGVALLACWLPALRATKVDPLTALRSE